MEHSTFQRFMSLNIYSFCLCVSSVPRSLYLSFHSRRIIFSHPCLQHMWVYSAHRESREDTCGVFPLARALLPPSVLAPLCLCALRLWSSYSAGLWVLSYICLWGEEWSLSHSPASAAHDKAWHEQMSFPTSVKGIKCSVLSGLPKSLTVSKPRDLGRWSVWGRHIVNVSMEVQHCSLSSDT